MNLRKTDIPPSAGAATDMAKDPVCGMTVDEKSSKFTSQHDGVTFYFCSQQCKTTFDGNPHRYGHASH
jgi:Cu+-exporting ATPase